MFEKASKLKLRYTTPNGNLNTEDLWDLPLTAAATRANLDDIAKGLHKQLKNDDDVSFVVSEKKSDSLVQLKFDIVKHIIECKLAENASKAEAKQVAQQKQVVLGIMREYENEELRENIKKMSPEERKAMVAGLNG